MRIVVKGTSGSGKTTLAKELAARMGRPFVELDAFVHLPGWVEASDDETRRGVEAAIAGHESWVVDGNYERKVSGGLIARADLIVWLDLPLPVKLARMLTRSWHRWRTGEPLWNGNVETLRSLFAGGDSLLLWTVRSHFRHRREWPSKLAGRNVTRLRTPAEVARWLDGFRGVAR